MPFVHLSSRRQSTRANVRQGFSMASNLPKAGYQLVVHDADDAKVQRAATEWPNTTSADGSPEAFADCEVIITMLPQGKIVREVLLGKDNFARSLKPGRQCPLRASTRSDIFARHHYSRYIFIFTFRYKSFGRRTCPALPAADRFTHYTDFHAVR